MQADTDEQVTHEPHGDHEPMGDGVAETSEAVTTVAAPAEEAARYLKETITTVVEHELTDEEMLEVAAQLVETRRFRESEENERKRIDKERKAKVATLDAEIDRLFGLLESGEEDRSITCRIRLDDASQQRVYENIETGEIVKTETFRYGDDQLELDLSENERRELEAAHTQGREAFDDDKTKNPFDAEDEDALHTAWQQGWEEREAELASEPAGDLTSEPTSESEAESEAEDNPDENQALIAGMPDMQDSAAMIEHFRALKSALEADVHDSDMDAQPELYERTLKLRRALTSWLEQHNPHLTNSQHASVEFMKSDLVDIAEGVKPAALG